MTWRFFSDRLVGARRESASYLEFDAAFSPTECSSIVGLYDLGHQERAEFSWGVSGTHSRRSDISWLELSSETQWLYERVIDYVSWSNDIHFKFALDGRVDAFQLTRYRVGDGYEWHQDLGRRRESRRKVTVAIQLTDGVSYEGGDVEVFRAEGEPTTLSRRAGSLAIFPSWNVHRVRPVVSGTRWSLVNWFEGPPFT